MSRSNDDRGGLMRRMTRPGTLLLLALIGLLIVFGLGRTSDGIQIARDSSGFERGLRDGEVSEDFYDETAEDYDDADDDPDSERRRSCIYVRSIDGFHVIDDRHITVSTGPRHIYLVTLFNRCRQLNWTHKIAIKSHGSWTCSYSKDTLLVDGDRCLIDDIEPVASVAEAEALVAERTGKSMDEEEEGYPEGED